MSEGLSSGVAVVSEAKLKPNDLTPLDRVDPVKTVDHAACAAVLVKASSNTTALLR